MVLYTFRRHLLPPRCRQKMDLYMYYFLSHFLCTHNFRLDSFFNPSQGYTMRASTPPSCNSFPRRRLPPASFLFHTQPHFGDPGSFESQSAAIAMALAIAGETIRDRTPRNSREGPTNRDSSNNDEGQARQ